jgi:hypothetical protein
MNPQCLDGSLSAGISVPRCDVQPKVAERRALILRFAGRVSVYFMLTAVNLGMWYALSKFGQWALR